MLLLHILIVMMSLVFSIKCKSIDTESESLPTDFLTTCLQNIKRASCRENHIEIERFFYTCKAIGAFDDAPRRISVDGDLVSVYVKNTVFRVKNGRVVGNEYVTAPIGSIEDRRNNKFYTSEGNVYVLNNDTGKEIEILTKERYGFKQLALDKYLEQLFILPVNTDSKSTNELYVLNTRNVHSNDVIEAEKIRGIRGRFTAIGIDPRNRMLYLGVQDDVGGKLVQLNRLDKNPCSDEDEKRDTFQSALNNMTYMLMNVFDRSIQEQSDSPKCNKTVDSPDFRKLQSENLALQNQLEMLKKKFSSITNRLLNAANGISMSNQLSDLHPVENLKNNTICILEQEKINYINKISHLENNYYECFSKIDSFKFKVKDIIFDISDLI